MATNRVTYRRWNASRAFASYLDAHPELYRDKSVLELGAGGGLPGLVTVKNGAKLVSKNTLFRVDHPTDSQVYVYIGHSYRLSGRVSY